MDAPQLPSGRITLVFTDIEESTRATRAIGGDLYRERMLRPLDERIQTALREHGGFQVRTLGDGHFIAFEAARARQALACVVALQQGLEQRPITCEDKTGRRWTVLIRVGVHTAEEELQPYEYGDYIGDDVNYAARLQALGRGGQVIVSKTTYRAAGSPGRFAWKEWPERRVKSFDEGETVWELLWDDGETRGEPGSRWLPSWYRRDLNQFVGRTDLLAEIRNWLVRKKDPLLILIGGSGIGKTRMVVETVLGVCGQFEAGVAFVALDCEVPADRDRVTAAQLAAIIAAAVHAPPEVVADAERELVVYLNESASGLGRLVVLDSWECVQNPQTLRWLVDAVRETQSVRWLLTTSVEPGLAGVGQFKTIPPLDVPRDDARALGEFDSYTLFAARVRQQREDHPIDDLAAIRLILQQTDGYPLAIELAAALVADYSLHEVARMMQGSLLEALRTPVADHRPGPGRHLSMERNLDWSIAQLPAEQRAVFPRLAELPETFSSAEAEARRGLPDEWLHQWRRCGLLERDERERVTRFRLPRVVREWCRLHLRPADTREIARAAVRRIDDPGVKLADLIALWQGHDRGSWAGHPEAYPRLAERLLRLGEPLVALDVLAQGLELRPADVRLRQLRGLGLARTGQVAAAQEILEQLFREGPDDVETIGLLGRILKDLGTAAGQAGDPAARDAFYLRALERYHDAYVRFRSSWTGINAATLALLLGRRELAHPLARALHEECRRELREQTEQGGDPYWTLAILGEVGLILGEKAEAEYWYRRAAEECRGRYGDLQATWGNARLLLDRHLPGIDGDRIKELLKIPNVVVFVGHMIDRPDRPAPRFPPEWEDAVALALRDRLRALDARIGYASAACGSDILFLEAIHALAQERGGEAHVVLPYDREQFVSDSVEVAPAGLWRERFDRALDQAEVVASPARRLEFGGISYDFANRVLQGLATIRARQLGTGLTFLAVWDGRSGDGPGGTADTVRRWRAQGHRVEVIDPSREVPDAAPVLEAAEPDPAPPPPTVGARAEALGMRIMAVLIARITDFDQLDETGYPSFVAEFLGLVARLLADAGCDPLKRNAWGDGLYFTFDDVREAGGFALLLCERVAAVDWAGRGLPSGLALRVGLHAGPVYCCKDPVTGQHNSIGTHVSRAARIVDVALAGRAYASQEFAALAAADGVEDFQCLYMGRAPLPGDRGTSPVYQVVRAGRAGPKTGSVA